MDPWSAGLARANPADVERAWEAVRDAERPRIHTFVSTSDIHIDHQLQATREDVKGLARASVAQAKGYCDDVEFSPMDATRADLDFTAEVVQIAIDEGATTINIPDTVGYAMPAGVRRLPDAACTSARRACATSCSRCTATTTWGWRWPTPSPACVAGARQVECAINGIGERAGNASLEEIVMLLHTRQADIGLTHRASTRARSRARAAWSAASPATRCSPTRRSSGATPSPTSRASTRTASSRSARPTRSWTRPRWGWTPTSSSSASTPAATRCARRWRSWATRSTARR